MSAEKVPQRRHPDSGLEPLEPPGGSRGDLLPGSGKAEDAVTLTRRVRTRCSEFIAGWSRPLRRGGAHPRHDLRWTCPDCRVRHETVINSDAEAGSVVEVNCQGCGTRHEASVFFWPRRPAETRMIVGIVWL
jgi:hypothetical protein